MIRMLSSEQARRTLEYAARWASYVGVTRLLEWARRRTITVLRVRLTPDSTDPDFNDWTTDSLAEALRIAQQYSCLMTPDELADAMRDPAEMPLAPALLSFTLTSPRREFPLHRVLSEVGVPCMIAAAPALLDDGLPPWPLLIREAVGRVESGAVDMYERRWSLGTEASREKAIAEIIERLSARPEPERHACAVELVRGWNIDPETIHGLQWTDFERLAHSEHVTPATCGLTGDSLARMTLDRAIWELRESRARMSEALGMDVRHLVYPWGESNALVEKEAENAGYRVGIAQSVTDGIMNFPDVSPYRLLSRALVPGERDLVRADLAGLIAFIQPAVDFFTRRR